MKKVLLTLYASNLKNVAGFGKGTSDPYAIVTFGETQLGQTEVIKNNLSPIWTTSFIADYTKELEQALTVQIFDEVSKGKHKPMGSATFELGDIINASGNIKAASIKEGGTLCVRVQPMARFDRGTLNLELRGVKLANVESFSKSDPFFEIQAATKAVNGARTWHPVYRSEAVMNNLKPVWKECQISIEALCGGNQERPIQIQVFDWEKSGKHQTMGIIQTTTKALMSAVLTNSILQLRDGGGRRFGTMMATKAEITGEELDPGNPPPRFKTINGVRGFNPKHTEWQKKYAGGAKQRKAAAPKLAYRAP
jgi:Ca2+-dependent lipid-binding protein